MNTGVKKHLISLDTSGPSAVIVVNKEALPYSLQPKADTLNALLSNRFTDCPTTRQVRRQIERIADDWVKKNKDPGYFRWNPTKQIFEIMPNKFPQNLRHELPKLSAMLNAVFTDWPGTEDTLQHMIAFTYEWIDIHTGGNKETLNSMYVEITEMLREVFANNPIESGQRMEASKLILEYITKKREVILSERQAKAAKAAGGGSQAGTGQSGRAGEGPDSQGAGLSEEVPGQGLQELRSGESEGGAENQRETA